LGVGSVKTVPYCEKELENYEMLHKTSDQGKFSGMTKENGHKSRTRNMKSP
jgi:hypothetical protein